MNNTQASLDITAVIKQVMADHTAYPLVVEQDNKSVVDQATQTKPYLKVEITFMPSHQLDLGDAPWVEQWGQIWISAVCKAGEGTAEARALLDFVTPYFELKRIGGVQCRSVSGGGKGKDVKGLWNERAIVNFYYHRKT